MESDTKRIEIKPIENRAEGGPQGSTGRIGRGPANKTLNLQKQFLNRAPFNNRLF